MINELLETAINELKFEKCKNEILNDLLIDLEYYIRKWVSHKLLKQVIKNWREKEVIETSIHNYLLFNKQRWQKNR